MKITVSLRGTLKKRIEGGQVAIDLPDGSTCSDAIHAIGINWEDDPSFGFVSVNGMRVMIDSPLKQGDLLKAFSRVGGG